MAAPPVMMSEKQDDKFFTPGTGLIFSPFAPIIHWKPFRGLLGRGIQRVGIWPKVENRDQKLYEAAKGYWGRKRFKMMWYMGIGILLPPE